VQVVRTRLRQTDSKYHGLLQTTKVIVREEGVRALYGGLTAHLMRVVPNAAIMFFCYVSQLLVSLIHTHSIIIDIGIYCSPFVLSSAGLSTYPFYMLHHYLFQKVVCSLSKVFRIFVFVAKCITLKIIFALLIHNLGLLTSVVVVEVV
jgi:hypothetical protein